MTNQQIFWATQITFGVIVVAGAFGATKLLPKEAIPAVPEAKKSELVSRQELKGTRAIGLIVENPKSLKKLTAVLTPATLYTVNKKGDLVPRDAVLFDSTEVQLFYAVTQEALPILMENLSLPYAGGISFETLPEDVEDRLGKLMHENGIKEYEIVTI